MNAAGMNVDRGDVEQLSSDSLEMNLPMNNESSSLLASGPKSWASILSEGRPSPRVAMTAVPDCNNSNNINKGRNVRDERIGRPKSAGSMNRASKSPAESSRRRDESGPKYRTLTPSRARNATATAVAPLPLSLQRIPPGVDKNVGARSTVGSTWAAAAAQHSRPMSTDNVVEPKQRPTSSSSRDRKFVQTHTANRENSQPRVASEFCGARNAEPRKQSAVKTAEKPPPPPVPVASYSTLVKSQQQEACPAAAAADGAEAAAPVKRVKIRGQKKSKKKKQQMTAASAAVEPMPTGLEIFPVLPAPQVNDVTEFPSLSAAPGLATNDSSVKTSFWGSSYSSALAALAPARPVN